MTNAGDETMTGQAQEWHPQGMPVPQEQRIRDAEMQAIHERLADFARALAQARAEADDVAATAHMMGHASRNDEVRALQAEVERLQAQLRSDFMASASAVGEADGVVKDLKAQLAQAREALERVRDLVDMGKMRGEAVHVAAGIARDALRRLQGGAEA